MSSKRNCVLKKYKYKNEQKAIIIVIKSWKKFPEIVEIVTCWALSLRIQFLPIKLPNLLGVTIAVKFPTYMDFNTWLKDRFLESGKRK